MPLVCFRWTREPNFECCVHKPQPTKRESPSVLSNCTCRLLCRSNLSKVVLKKKEKKKKKLIIDESQLGNTHSYS